MKKRFNLLSAFLLCGLILSACKASVQPSEAPSLFEETQAVEAAATELAATESATEVVVVQPPSDSTIQHASVPATPPTVGGEKWGDYSTISSLNPTRALIGDHFTNGKIERPYNANTMDVYFPQLDIDRVVLHTDDATWVYVVISMVGRDANNSFSGQYAIELDLDQYGYGDLLIVADQPASSDWTTQGVHVYADANKNVGGERPVLEDSAGAASDGFETVLFDQGIGNDADLAWVRLDPGAPNSIQIAFKQSLLSGENTYTAAIWAGTYLDPALFDYNDHFTHEQAGAANPEIVNFYPIKGISELDNTCREAIGFDPSGIEPGICPVQ